jgi:hypothetical protein
MVDGGDNIPSPSLGIGVVNRYSSVYLERRLAVV